MLDAKHRGDLRALSRKVMHSDNSPEWGTPEKFVVAARATMGHINLDPASCTAANQIVQAAQFYDAQDDGLTRPWYGPTFVNPPGGLVREFWAKLVAAWQAQTVEQAVWIGYSLQQLQQLQLVQGVVATPLDFPICFPMRRIAFNPIAGQPAAAPGHANYIAYLPKHGDPSSVGRFEAQFRLFGKVLVNGWD